MLGEGVPAAVAVFAAAALLSNLLLGSVEAVGSSRLLAFQDAQLLVSAWTAPSWTAGELSRMAGRALLQSLVDDRSWMPTCEMGVEWRVLQMEPSTNATQGGGFLSIVTLTNNREMELRHWQIVFRYLAYTSIVLASTDGATMLSPGSPQRAPVRIVDSWLDGVPGDGGSYTIMAHSRFLHPPSDKESLLIGDLNINGLDCSLVLSPDVDEDTCSEREARAAADPVSGTLGASPGGCQASFCCGVVMVNPGASPPPPPPSPALPPPAPPAPPLVPPARPSPSPQLEGAIMSPPAPPPGSPAPRGSGSSVSGPKLAAAIAGVAGGTGALALAGLLTRRCLRHQRRKRLHMASLRMVMRGAGVDSGQNAARSEGERGGTGAAQAAQPIAGALATLSLAGIAALQKAPTLAAAGAAAAAAGAGERGASSPECGCSACQTAVGQSSEGLAERVQLGELLGAGAFGRVFKGTLDGHPVAVKLLQTTITITSRELHSFRQEVAALSQLRHPNIVCLLAACTVPPTICIVEELAEGGSLHDRLHGRRGRQQRRRHQALPYEQLLEVAIDVASAMEYLHPNVVHRDLKSQNVLLDKDGRAKVCDFGICKFKDRTFVSTANGQAGTPAYMAPEMFDGARVTEKVDIFSFALLLWEMLTGCVPWSHMPSPMQIIYCVGVLGERPPLPPTCPPALAQLIQACWSDNPSARPPFTEILGILRSEHAVAVAAAEHRQPEGFSRAGAGEQQQQQQRQQAVGGGEAGEGSEGQYITGGDSCSEGISTGGSSGS